MATEKRLIYLEDVRNSLYEADAITMKGVALINQFPTVDAVEVVHGRWEWTETGEQDYEQFWVCSQCSDRTYFLTNFCPNCGAKMYGDGNED